MSYKGKRILWKALDGREFIIETKSRSDIIIIPTVGTSFRKIVIIIAQTKIEIQSRVHTISILKVGGINILSHSELLWSQFDIIVQHLYIRGYVGNL